MTARRCVECDATSGAWIIRRQNRRHAWRPVSRKNLKAAGLGPPPFRIPGAGKADEIVVAVKILDTPAGPKCDRCIVPPQKPRGAHATMAPPPTGALPCVA